MSCDFPAKRTFRTRELARAGAHEIRLHVGVAYQTLYPYKCPTERHWHLSHFRQGYAICPVCGYRKPAWRGAVWVMAAHRNRETKCDGVGSRVS
jgi:hypothetical protein